MKTLTRLSALLSYSLALTLAVGCSDSAKPNAKAAASKSEQHNHDGHDHGDHKHGDAGHAHPDHGPHGGDLVELGKEEYHAEVIHDDTGKTIVYILDSSAAKAVPIKAADVTINVKRDGKGEQYQLVASSQEGDGEDRSSRFVSEDDQLGKSLDQNARLVVEIEGKSYTGDIKHSHKHDGHDHDHKD